MRSGFPFGAESRTSRNQHFSISRFAARPLEHFEKARGGRRRPPPLSHGEDALTRHVEATAAPPHRVVRLPPFSGHMGSIPSYTAYWFVPRTRDPRRGIAAARGPSVWRICRFHRLGSSGLPAARLARAIRTYAPGISSPRADGHSPTLDRYGFSPWNEARNAASWHGATRRPRNPPPRRPLTFPQPVPSKPA